MPRLTSSAVSKMYLAFIGFIFTKQLYIHSILRYVWTTKSIEILNIGAMSQKRPYKMPSNQATSTSLANRSLIQLTICSDPLVFLPMKKSGTAAGHHTHRMPGVRQACHQMVPQTLIPKLPKIPRGMLRAITDMQHHRRDVLQAAAIRTDHIPPALSRKPSAANPTAITCPRTEP